MSKCKGCGKEIIWLKTKAGKSMPCELEKTTIITESGDTVIGRIPHWANCPNFKDFKEGKSENKNNNTKIKK